MVVALHWHINRDPELWGSDANAFRPERFLECEVQEKSCNSHSRNGAKLSIPTHFMPFQVSINNSNLCRDPYTAYYLAHIHIDMIVFFMVIGG